MSKYLIVVDMQKDFVDGSLGTKEAVEIVPLVREKIKNFDGKIIFTKDTHYADYLNTQEGQKLPVEHCIRGTEGWEIVPQLTKFTQGDKVQVFEKNTFGSTELAEYLKKRSYDIDSIEFVGLCTDICVISNALLIKANMPEIKLIADSKCMAGVTPEKHNAALETMRSCQIEII
ncbi:MAG: cysteine hydrolase [Lachnospiraceae bacterium]|nr:cysteine hydrolase [Lachnospiraceae bacterium]